jgi:hypothetical protein
MPADTHLQVRWDRSRAIVNPAHFALARVSLANGPPTLIALGAREPGALPVRQSVAVLAFLGRAVGAALSR